MTHEIVPEIDEALRIARNTRESLLVGSGKLESYLYGFFTVAQILGRAGDLEWARKELNGYDNTDVLPEYRDVPGLLTIDDAYVKTQDEDEFTNYNLFSSVSKLKQIMNLEKDPITFAINKKFVERYSNKIKPTQIDSSHVKILKSTMASVLGSIEFSLLEKLNNMISEITYEKIPQEIFKEFQTKVDAKLSDSNPKAVSTLNLAYESLGTYEDPNRIAQVALACRRLIKHVTDMVYPAQTQKYEFNYEGRKYILDLGDDKIFNRLTAYVDSKKFRGKNHLIDEINLLRNFYSGEEGFINRGIHNEINNAEAKKMVLYTYLILGDIILEEEK